MFTAVYDGFVNGETLENVGGAIRFLCEYENGSPAGDYEIQPEVTGLANYEVTAYKGTLSVQPRTPVHTDSQISIRLVLMTERHRSGSDDRRRWQDEL